MTDERGIDIRAAFEILADRKCCNDHTCANGHNDTATADESRRAGQIIDLFPTGTTTEKSEVGSDADIGPDESRKSKSIEIEAALEALSLNELLNTILSLQQERVAAYRLFEQALATLLTSNGYDQRAYTTCCANTTASFSFISDSIRNIAQVLLSKHKRNDLHKHVTELQRHEQEKLNLTAALHLERIRQITVQDDSPTANLLAQGVASLRSKLWDCVEGINLVLEEIRFSITDEA